MSGAPLPSSFDDDPDFYNENRWQKFGRRLKEEPLVPLGCILTCYALYNATKAMRRGDHHEVNRFFRYRIYAQGFTLLAVVAGGLYYKQDRQKRKKYEGLVAEKKAEEKKSAWIRELEARDEEDKLAVLRREGMRDQAYKQAMVRGIKDPEKERLQDMSVRREAAAKMASAAQEDATSESAESTGGGVVDAVKGMFRKGD
ncbi:MAG: Respiratory supercomplex factor 1, mitochondrial [Piccolia ochrophora]|nr:MAG: Respiratory supercomplex factor 1, mitochondrial [Piccolia ochrophora]